MASGWRWALCLALTLGLLGGWLPLAPAARAATLTFEYTGATQTWIVPAGVTAATFDVYGAEGGTIARQILGGRGGRATATLALTPGVTVRLRVGGHGLDGAAPCGTVSTPIRGGFNGGGDGGNGGCEGGGGGGASDVRLSGDALADRALVGGGGGGASNWYSTGCIVSGGAGGGLTGGEGRNACTPGTEGGDQTGTHGSGIAGQGGAGASNTDGNMWFVNGGGGGGGYYGGAGGQKDFGGGGGSGFGPSGTAFETGVRQGHGLIVVTFTVPQTINFPQPPDRLFGAAPFAVSATGGTSGNPVTFATDTPAVCMIGSPTTATSATVTVVGVGTCTVVANQAGDAGHYAAPPVTRSFAVSNAVPALTGVSPPGVAAGSGDTVLTLTGGIFGPQATVQFGGTTLIPQGIPAPTTTALTVVIPAFMLIDARTVAITVTNPGPGNAISAPQPFAITPPPPPPPTPGQSTVTASAVGGGTVIPAGATGYATGSQASYAAAPAAGQVFVGWSLDGQYVGFASSLTFTVATDRTLVAIFAPRPAFRDVPPGGTTWEAITQLAARGVIRGYADGRFGPGDTVQRAQEAALLVRALGWGGDAPAGSPPFGDLGTMDPELQRAVLILAQRGIARGYGDGRFGPTDEVLHAQVISFIARSMVQAGYWQAATTDNPALYPDVPLASGHRLDLLTFVAHAGPLPDRPIGQGWADWDAPASRGWAARVLWQAYSSHYGVDRIP